jgi:hypothetical protein
VDAMPEAVSPIFILSLPRSGSTLTQKILASHPQIASAAEPWLLLPFVYALRSEGIYTEYAQGSGSHAIREFVRELPAGVADYHCAIRDMALRLYTDSAGDNKTYFLDKTPRYHLIINEMMEIFPDAKFILLWRNPLAVAASMLRTWGKDGRWNLHRYKIDAYQGIENLVEAAALHADRMLQVRYEDMVSEPATAWRAIFSHLRLEFDPRVLEEYTSVQFAGSMVGPAGIKEFKEISTESIDDWTNAFRSPLRRMWARRYLEWIGEERLRVMGYAQADITRMLDGPLDFNPARVISDAVFMTIGAAHAAMDLSGLKRQLGTVISGKRCYAAT